MAQRDWLTFHRADTNKRIVLRTDLVKCYEDISGQSTHGETRIVHPTASRGSIEVREPFPVVHLMIAGDANAREE